MQTKFLILERKVIDENPWIKGFMNKSQIYIIRPDRYIFGSTSDNINFSDLTKDLKKRLGI